MRTEQTYNKSTQLRDAFIGHARQLDRLTRIKLGRLVLSQFVHRA